MRMDAGPVRIGSQGGNTLMHSLLDSRSALFEGVEGGSVKAVKGISLSFDVASFFFLTSPRFITGFSLDIGGFLLGYAHAAADTIDDEYFLSYNERYGYEADVLQAGYTDEHFLFKIKLSHQAEAHSCLRASLDKDEGIAVLVEYAIREIAVHGSVDGLDAPILVLALQIDLRKRYPQRRRRVSDDALDFVPVTGIGCVLVTGDDRPFLKIYAFLRQKHVCGGKSYILHADIIHRKQYPL